MDNKPLLLEYQQTELALCETFTNQQKLIVELTAHLLLRKIAPNEIFQITNAARMSEETAMNHLGKFITDAHSLGILRDVVKAVKAGTTLCGDLTTRAGKILEQLTLPHVHPPSPTIPHRVTDEK